MPTMLRSTWSEVSDVMGSADASSNDRLVGFGATMRSATSMCVA